MTMMGGRFPQGKDEVGQTVAGYPTYEAAQKAVSALIAADVPAREIAIVGKGLRSIERVTGRLGYAAAARSGAVNGLLLGMLFSAILVIGSPTVPIQAFVGVLFVGIAIGMLLSLVTYSLVRRRRDFASVMQVAADHYEVTVSAASLNRARGILNAPGAASESTPTAASDPPPAAPAPAAPEAPPTEEPPRYGERITPPARSGDGSGAPETAAPGASPDPAAPDPAAPDRAPGR
jgi:xanthosine utilization system XapX-like protein